jgi:hypothetical protein
MCVHKDDTKDDYFNNCIDKEQTDIHELTMKTPFLYPNPKLGVFC